MMPPLSAADAISPALRHTRELLVASRRWGTFLKIAAIAFFAQIGGCNSVRSLRNHHQEGVPAHIAAMIFTFALAFMAIGLVVWLLFFYLRSRLQFTLFEIVLRRDTTVAPIWSRYGAATWRWIGLKLLYWFAVLAAIAPIVVPAGIRFFHSIPKDQATPAELLHFFASIMGFVGLIFIISILAGAVFILLLDFGLPSMALESTTLGETLARVGRLFRAEPGQVLLYILLRMIFGFIFVMTAEIVVVIASLIALIPFGGTGFALWKVLAHAALGGKILFGISIGVLGLVYIGLVVCAFIMACGSVYVFLQAYALYFLGGRYPMVGQYLERYLAAPQVQHTAQPWHPGLYTPPPV